jgi:hypothetical protein
MSSWRLKSLPLLRRQLNAMLLLQRWMQLPAAKVWQLVSLPVSLLLLTWWV